MKNNNYLAVASLLSIITLLSSCEIVGGIFKAGFWTGAILIVVVIVILVIGIAKLGGKK